MVLKDAEKEFDQHSRIGFGLDGDEQEKLEDFENIRGTYDGNSFVTDIRNESAKTESTVGDLIKKLEFIAD